MAISRIEHERARERAETYLKRAGVTLRDDEKAAIEIADFGLGSLEMEGLELITYVNTERCCAKELVLFPGQTCPEHRHPPLGPDKPGKEETFRCRWGTVYLYVARAPGSHSRRKARKAPPKAATKPRPHKGAHRRKKA